MTMTKYYDKGCWRVWGSGAVLCDVVDGVLVLPRKTLSWFVVLAGSPSGSRFLLSSPCVDVALRPGGESLLCVN